MTGICQPTSQAHCQTRLTDIPGWGLVETMSYADFLRLKSNKRETNSLPTPTVDVTSWCLELEASIASSHPAMMRYFDRKVFEATVLDHQPVVDVKSFCKGIEDHIRVSHDWFFTMFEFRMGGYIKEKNVVKMWEKLHARRLKARAMLQKMWANPKKRAIIEQAQAELLAENEARLKRSKSKSKVTFSPKVTVVELLPEPTMTMEELDRFSEKVAKETIQFLTYVVEEQLDDVYRLQSAMIEFNESLFGFSSPMVYMPSFKKNVE